MAIKSRDIYDGRKKRGFRFGVAAFIILAVLIAAILVFYWLRSCCVYDEDGNATLILPFSQKTEQESPTESPTESPAESPTASPTESPTESPMTSPAASPADSPAASGDGSNANG